MTSEIMSTAYTHIYFATYIKGDKWWIKDGVNWWNRTTKYNCDILYYTKIGRFDLKIGKEWYHIAPDQMLYVPAGTELTYSFDGQTELEKHYVHFDLMFGNNKLSDLFNMPYVIDVTDTRRAQTLFCELYGSLDEAAFSDIASSGALLSLISFFLKESKAEFIWKNKKLNSTMQTAVQYIHDNLDKNISIKEIATLAGYSDDHFAKKFKEIFGCTPGKYIADLKLNRAKLLLKTTDMSVSEISNRLGFCSSGYFANFFKSKTGLFPTYYRK